MVAHVVVVANLKGGSGKSTIAVNVASALGTVGAEVAMLDCDPQGSVATWAQAGNTRMRVRFEPLRHLDRAGAWLAEASQMRTECDVLVIDLPAVIAPAMASAFLAASLILIPTAPTTTEVEGTRRVLGYIAAAHAERAASPFRTLLVPNRVRPLEQGIGDWRPTLGRLGLAMSPAVSHHSAFDRAFAAGDWVGGMFPGSAPHVEVEQLTDAVCDELAQVRPYVPPLTSWTNAEPPKDTKVVYLDAHNARHARLYQQQPWWRRLLAAG